MKKEYDLTKMKKRPGKIKTDPDAAKIAISIRLEGCVLADLRSEAERLGIPYQTFIGSILHRYVHGELLDRRDINLKRLVG
jgi:predicted DNA binding CopG/RHH family protein